jgi:proteasome lid subunit RPN8/RPN11
VAIVSLTDWYYEQVLREQLRDLTVEALLERAAAAGVPVAPRPPAGVRGASRPAAPSRRRATSMSEVELRERAPARFELRLAGNVDLEIEREVGTVVSQFGQVVETGGLLFSHYRPDSKGVLVCFASDSGPNGEHSPRSLRFSSEKAVRAEFGEHLARADLRLVGCWHTHPNGNGTPSSADLGSWAARLDLEGLPCWSSVIVTTGELGFCRFHGWTTSKRYDPRTDRRTTVCEPAHVITP